MPKPEVRYLIIKADKSCRITATTRSLADDEIAIRLNLTFPTNWGSTVGSVDIAIPDFTPTVSEFKENSK